MAVRLLVLWVLLILAGCSSTPPVRGDAEPRADAVVSALEAQYREWGGVPYRHGGYDRSGIDCSAFVQLTLSEQLGVRVPRTTQAQRSSGHSVAQRHLEPGDLVFFRTGKGAYGQHVGIYAGEGRFLHASTSQGVTMSRLDNPYWGRTYRQARRVLPGH